MRQCRRPPITAPITATGAWHRFLWRLEPSDGVTYHADMNPTAANESIDWHELAGRIRQWARELGFERVGITDTELDDAEANLDRWLAEGRHADMDWMAVHGRKRTRPAELVPGTIRVISVGMNYWPEGSAEPRAVLRNGTKGYVARYALGRDYHKVMRRRLQQLADRMVEETGPFGYRAFTDSAPVMEKPLGQKSALGTQGKHTCLIDDREGSCRCRSINRAIATCAAPAAPASMCARPGRSPRPTKSTPASASPTRRSRTAARFPRVCAR